MLMDGTTVAPTEAPPTSWLSTDPAIRFSLSHRVAALVPRGVRIVVGTGRRLTWTIMPNRRISVANEGEGRDQSEPVDRRANGGDVAGRDGGGKDAPGG